MKKILYILPVMLLLFIATASAADPLLKASLSKYDPTPAEPGSFVTVYIQIENAGNGDAEDATIEIIPSFPFEIGENERVKHFGTLGSGTEYVEEFRVRVDPEAFPGTNRLKVRFTHDPDTNNWLETEFNINVDIEDPIISVEAVQTSPAAFVPGEEGTVSITLKNNAPSYLKDVRVKLNLATTTSTNSLTGESSVTNNVPFIPVGSSSEKIVGRISAQNSETFTFALRTYPTATPQLYKVPVTITYVDSNGNSFEKEDLIGIVVNAEPELYVDIDSTTLLQESKTGSVTLKFVNRGVSDVKFLTVTLQESDKYKILSPSNRVYIGNVDSDDFDTAEFQVALANGNYIELPFSIEYRDANNNEYKRDGIAKLTLRSQQEVGQASGGGTLYVVIVLVLIVVGIWLWRRNVKKKRRQN